MSLSLAPFDLDDLEESSSTSTQGTGRGVSGECRIFVKGGIGCVSCTVFAEGDRGEARGDFPFGDLGDCGSDTKNSTLSKELLILLLSTDVLIRLSIPSELLILNSPLQRGDAKLRGDLGLGRRLGSGVLALLFVGE